MHALPEGLGRGQGQRSGARQLADSTRSGRRTAVVAIATSTGGPAALQRLFKDLPGDFAIPILVVQHITPGFVPGLASWLNSVCDLHVKVVGPFDGLSRSALHGAQLVVVLGAR